jgi:hypothetical protein
VCENRDFLNEFERGKPFPAIPQVTKMPIWQGFEAIEIKYFSG